MDCQHDGCVCTSEVAIERDGRLYCSEYCARAAAPPSTSPTHCLCGHAGCASEESGTAIPEAIREV